MNKQYFKDADDLVSECQTMERDDRDDSEDRAILSAFYNGRDTMSEEEADERGVSNVVNHLFGYDSVASARDQIFSIYNKSDTIWKVKLPNADPVFRQKWENLVTTEFNKAIKSSRRLRPVFKSLSGDLTLFGSAHPMFLNSQDWCPKIKRPLVPRGTGILPRDVDYMALPSYLTIRELEKYLKKAKTSEGRGVSSGWKKEQLETCLKLLKGQFKATKVAKPEMGNYEQSPEHREFLEQETATEDQLLRTKIAVYYVYQARHDEEGSPVDLSIVARYTPADKEKAKKKKLDLNPLLFDKDRHLESMDKVIVPFFLDCNLDGETTWHRVMGLGRLNYEPDVDVEEFFNIAMQGSKENMQRLFSVRTASDLDVLDRWLSGEEYSNVLPDGVSLVEQQKNPNFQHAFTVLQMLGQVSKTNARNAQSNSGIEGMDELEVQSLERQGRNAQAISVRIADVYDCLDDLGKNIFMRFTAPNPIHGDEGYEEVRRFQKRMKQEGIPLSLLRATEEDGGLLNVQVMTNRVIGDGNMVRETMASRVLLSRMHLYPPESQKKILQRVTALETNDWKLAEELVPIQEKPDGGQVGRANNENDTCHFRGLTGYVPPINEDDLHIVHLPEHLGGLQAYIAKGKLKGWDEQDLAGFRVLGAHALAHVNAVKSIPEQKDQARQYEQALQELARQGQEFEKNLQQQKQAQEQQMTPKEQADLQLKGAKHELDMQKEQNLVSHRKESLDFSKAKAAKQLSLQERQQGEASKAQDLKQVETVNRLQNERAQIQNKATSDLEKLQIEREKAAAAAQNGDLDAEGKPKKPEEIPLLSNVA